MWVYRQCPQGNMSERKPWHFTQRGKVPCRTATLETYLTEITENLHRNLRDAGPLQEIISCRQERYCMKILKEIPILCRNLSQATHTIAALQFKKPAIKIPNTDNYLQNYWTPRKKQKNWPNLPHSLSQCWSYIKRFVL